MHRLSRTAALFLLLAAPVACDSGEPDPPTPVSIELTADVDVLPAGQTAVLDVVVRDEEGDSIPNPNVQFESSNTGIATVDGEGIVTGEGEGGVTITATAGTVSDEVSIAIVEFQDPCTEALRVIPGEPVRSSLQQGDCTFESDGSFFDLWFFDLTEAASVTIEMTSDEVDSYLILLDETSTIAETDGGGSGEDARIDASLEAGRYFIAAATWPGESGAYTLSVDVALAAMAGTASAALRSGTGAPERVPAPTPIR